MRMRPRDHVLTSNRRFELGSRLYLTLTGCPQEAAIPHLVRAELKWCETFRKLTQAAIRIVPFKRSGHNSFCVLYRRDRSHRLLGLDRLETSYWLICNDFQ